MNNRIELVNSDTQEKIVADYLSGKKLRAIEEQYDVTRSQVYWVLDQNNVAPERTKPKSRLEDGNPLTIERLYAILEAQDQRLQAYESLTTRVLGSLAAFSDQLQSTMSDDAIAEMRRQVGELGKELARYLSDVTSEPNPPKG